MVSIMALGFVLVKTEPGREQQVYERLVGEPNIVEMFPLFGEWDLIVKMEAPDFDALGSAIVNGIRKVPGITTTYTLTVTKL